MRISDWSSDVCSSDLGGGGPGFGLLFRSAFGRHRLKSLYHDFHLESRRMMRAMAMDEPVFGRRQVLCRRPFLEPRFGMLGRGRLVFQPLRPMFPDKALGRLHAVVQRQRAVQRFGAVAKHVVAIGGPILAGLAAKLQMLTKANPTGDVGADRADRK